MLLTVELISGADDFYGNGNIVGGLGVDDNDVDANSYIKKEW